MLIKIGNILLDLNDISSISKTHCSDPTYRGSYNIQIVYKSSIVKNFRSDEISLDYDTFINTVLELQEKIIADKNKFICELLNETEELRKKIKSIRNKKRKCRNYNATIWKD